MIIIYVYFSVKIVEFKVRFVNGWKGLETPSEISEIYTSLQIKVIL